MNCNHFAVSGFKFSGTHCPLWNTQNARRELASLLNSPLGRKPRTRTPGSVLSRESVRGLRWRVRVHKVNRSSGVRMSGVAHLQLCRCSRWTRPLHLDSKTLAVNLGWFHWLMDRLMDRKPKPGITNASLLSTLDLKTVFFNSVLLGAAAVWCAHSLP